MIVAIVLSPTNAASPEHVVGSAQRVVGARARAPRDTAVHHCNYMTIDSTYILLKIFLPSPCGLSTVCVHIIYHLTSTDRYRQP